MRGGGPVCFRAYAAIAGKLHDFVCVAASMEGFVLQEIRGLKLRALIVAHVPQVICDILFGTLLRAPDPAVDVFNETQVVQRGEFVNSRVLGMPAKWHEHLRQRLVLLNIKHPPTTCCRKKQTCCKQQGLGMNTCDRASCS